LPDREQFIDTQVAFQFGICEAPFGTNVAEVAREAAKGRASLFYYNPSDRTLLPPQRASTLSFTPTERWHFVQGARKEIVGGAKLSVERQADALNELSDAGLCQPVIVDMHDAIRRENIFPVFQYNRLAGARNAILWPLDRVHKIGSKSFCSPLDPNEKPFRDKKRGLCWRGAIRGFVLENGKPVNIRAVVQRFQNGEIDRGTLLTSLEALPRYQFVSRYFDRDGFDIGFNNRTQDRKGWSELPELARYQKPYAGPAEQAEYKYLFSIQGTDVGSSFGWQLSTNSVILRETYPWEVFFDCHFRPWEHYVPIRPDFSDIVEKIEWCESHPEECQRMIDLRHATVPLLLDRTVRSEVLRRVVTRYAEFYARGDYHPPPTAN
jgi:hypothetical protein